MSIQIVCIGNELLLGETINTNLAFLAGRLSEAGLQVDAETCIPDDADVMTASIRRALDQCEVVITVGGLGPTRDDLTKEVVADILGVGLATHEPTADRIRRRYRERGIPENHTSIRKQSQYPTGAELLPNDWGTAPGVWARQAEKSIILLPGPPRELYPMFDQLVLPKLREAIAPSEVRRYVTVYGVPESQVASRAEAALSAYPEIAPSYCTKWAGVAVRLTASPDQAERLAGAANAVREAFGDEAVLGQPSIVESVAGFLRPRGWQLATAESCTGGGIGSRITDEAGISDVYVGGVVTYSNDLKRQLLGVREATLAEHGAVSDQTAREMVEGLVERLRVEVGISVTGVAGPDGGTPRKPVGTVFIGSHVVGATEVREYHFHFDRRGVRERTVNAALTQLREQLNALT